MHTMLFGGSFDPPHLGHLRIAQHVMARKIADQLIFIPCKNHPFDKKMSPSADRLAMLEMLKPPRTSVSLYEIEKPGKSYSLETLEYFSHSRPKTTFSWLVGADQVGVFHQWHEYQKLLEKFKVYVYPRAGYSLDRLMANMELLSTLPPVEVSSTQVRESVRAGRPIRGLVPPPVERYIHAHGLYNEG